MSEFRRDPITGRRVIIAAARASRPWHMGSASAPERTDECPFCAGNEALTPPEVWADRDPSTRTDRPGWSVRVVPNKYPAVADCSGWSRDEDRLYLSSSGFGVHEVIVESPEHIVNIAGVSTAQFRRILHAYRTRLRLWQNDPRWSYVFIYKNQGERAGATIEHIHSQLIALPLLPDEVGAEIAGLRSHFEETGQCLYCALVEREASSSRLVLECGGFIAFCPFAPRFGYEVWVVPKVHGSSLAQASDAEIAALADLLRTLIAKLNCVQADAPFNYVIHSAPAGGVDANYHWNLKILPQFSRAAGFEWGSGMHMNPVTPEVAARVLRDAPD